jgi:hypothetical protein
VATSKGKPAGPLAYLRKEARLAAKGMRPDKVLWRVFGHGPQPTAKRIKARAKRRLGSQVVPRQSPEEYERLMKRAAAARKPAAKTAKKSAAKQSGSAVYAAARKIPAQNRAVAAKAAQAGRQPAGKKAVAVRLADGRFNGSEAMGPRDRAQYEQLYQAAQAPAPTRMRIKGKPVVKPARR